jgi:hypothetical protein
MGRCLCPDRGAKSEERGARRGERWAVVSGQWAVVSGQWAVVSGQWSMVRASWFVGRGSRVAGRGSRVAGRENGKRAGRAIPMLRGPVLQNMPSKPKGIEGIFSKSDPSDTPSTLTVSISHFFAAVFWPASGGSRNARRDRSLPPLRPPRSSLFALRYSLFVTPSGSTAPYPARWPSCRSSGSPPGRSGPPARPPPAPPAPLPRSPAAARADRAGKSSSASGSRRE